MTKSPSKTEARRYATGLPTKKAPEIRSLAQRKLHAPPGPVFNMLVTDHHDVESGDAGNGHAREGVCRSVSLLSCFDRAPERQQREAKSAGERESPSPAVSAP
jgi:hypothetical protein